MNFAPIGQNQMNSASNTSANSNSMNNQITSHVEVAAAQEKIGEVVGRFLEQLNSGCSFDELLDSIYAHLGDVVPYNRIGVATMGDEESQLELLACRSDGALVLDVGYSAEIAPSTLNRLLTTATPRIIDDLAEYLARNPSSRSTQLIVQEGMRSSLTLPLIAEGKPIGVVFFSSRSDRAFNQEHADLLRKVAGPIAIAVEKARLVGELHQRNEQLAEANRVKDQFLDKLKEEVDRQTVELRKSEGRHRLLVKLGKIVNSTLDLKQVFERAAYEIHQLCHCDRVSLLQIGDRQRTRGGFAVEFQRNERWIEIPVQELAGSGTEWVLENGRPHICHSLADQCRFPESERLLEQGFQCCVYLPLFCREQRIGMLSIASRRTGQAEQWDLELLVDLCDQLSTAVDNASAYGEIGRLKAHLEEQMVYLQDEIRTAHDFSNIVGDSPSMWEVRRAIQLVADTNSTALILGETGTGKELVARAIHDAGDRRDGLLVKVNCAALAPGIITSELFGHESGAFTGAAGRRQGRFEIAQNGTIFLDEIGEIPLETQVMLLRVLQERVIERVGGNEPIEVDVRVLAATNRDLSQMVEEGQFRRDLFYRLNVYPIQIPLLRERREDIPALINYFIGRFSCQMNREITRVNRRAMELLMQYSWPGNVRELENIIERAMIVSSGDTLEIDEKWLAGKVEASAAKVLA